MNFILMMMMWLKFENLNLYICKSEGCQLFLWDDLYDTRVYICIVEAAQISFSLQGVNNITTFLVTYFSAVLSR